MEAREQQKGQVHSHRQCRGFGVPELIMQVSGKASAFLLAPGLVDPES